MQLIPASYATQTIALKGQLGSSRSQKTFDLQLPVSTDFSPPSQASQHSPFFFHSLLLAKKFLKSDSPLFRTSTNVRPNQHTEALTKKRYIQLTCSERGTALPFLHSQEVPESDLICTGSPVCWKHLFFPIFQEQVQFITASSSRIQNPNYKGKCWKKLLNRSKCKNLFKGGGGRRLKTRKGRVW